MKGNINLISYDCYQQATEKQLAGLKWKENRVYYISEIHNEKMQDEIYGYIDDRCRRLSLSTVVNDIYRFDLLKEFLNEKCTSCSSITDKKWEELERSYKAFLYKKGLALYVRRNRPDRRNVEQQSSAQISFLKMYYEYVVKCKTADIPENEKDVWDMRKLDIVPRSNPIRGRYRLDFREIRQKEFKEIIKRILYSHCQTKAMGSIKGELRGFRRFAKENRLIRNEPGEGDYQESLNYIEEDSGEKGQIVLNLQERTLTAAEWKEILPEAEKEAEEVFRNGQQADHVSGQVVLCERVKNGLISVEWKLEPDIWIDLQGNIEEENLFPGQVVNATAILSNGKNQAEHSFPICLYPSENQNETNLGKKIEQYLYNQNAEEKEVELPQNMDGVALRWEEETEKPLVIFLFLGIFAAVVILWSGKKEQQDAKKRWEEELVKDYPEMVSRLGLLLEAGMSLRQAWKKLTDTYESKRKKQRLPKRAGYEEMLLTRRELEDGMGESLAYERFGERCGLASYRRFASILTQNLKKGTVGIGRILAKESEDAFSQRKTMAQRLGEEAGTKLLFPMLMMMVVIMVILVVPACMTMHI